MCWQARREQVRVAYRVVEALFICSLDYYAGARATPMSRFTPPLLLAAAIRLPQRESALQRARQRERGIVVCITPTVTL